MYVLMDMEWVQNEERTRWPSQIAAMRVNERWQSQDLFYTRIQPRDESFCLWNHAAYTGGTIEDFLSAPSLDDIIKLVFTWFRADDVLCWWATGPMEFFEVAFGKTTQRQLVIIPYLQSFLVDQPFLAGSPFHIADQLRIERCGKRHDARSDIEMMRRALQKICFPQMLLMESLSEAPYDEKTRMPYVLDSQTNRIHKRECDKLPTACTRKEYPALKYVVANGCKPCSCCASEFFAERRQRNQWIVEESNFNYIYSPNSKIFHTRNCKIVLSSAAAIRGTTKYSRCIEKGRKPCKVCKPVPAKGENLSKKNMICGASKAEAASPKRRKHPEKRNLTDQEQRALKRLKQAQEERKNTPKIPGMSNQQLTDLQTLTHSGYAFWAATGYKRFHLRHCSRLNKVSNIKGFAFYEDAVQMGYRPCRQCKPTPKHNLEISFPFFSKERPGEHVGSIAALCNIVGYQYTELDGCFQIETPKGIWRVYTDSAPYRVEHINKRSTPGNTTEFHVQPRIFLSLTDVYMYIKRHDSDE